MNGKILVTDSLFIFDEHEKKLRDAGYEITRLDKAAASEDELIEAIKGKDGYILGGVEKVTNKVIDAADKLKVISFTGIGYKGYITAWEEALNKGIKITNAPDAPTQAVAEWAIGAALVMNRNILSFGKFGNKGFSVTKGIEDQTIGIIGLGRIGTRIAEMLKVFQPKQVNYYSTHQHPDIEEKLVINFKDVNDLLGSSDIVFLCIPIEAGESFFNKGKISKMKKDSLLVSFMHTGIINENDLYEAVSNGHIRAISDSPMGDKFNTLSVDSWYSFTGSNTVTESEAKLASDIVTESIINVLSGKPDKYLVNG